jgi:membrane associated rhomboid family serine protease
VAGSAAAWIVVNVVLGTTGLAPALDGAQIAWQAHIVGYGAGVLLIAPWRRLFAARDEPPRDPQPGVTR